MRLAFLCLVFAILSASAVGAESEQRVTRSFVNADLPSVLRLLAEGMGRKIYIWPTVHGTVTIELTDVPGEEAFRLVLAQQRADYDFRLLDGPSTHNVIVAPPDKLAQICSDLTTKRCWLGPPAHVPVRLEFLLEHASVEVVLGSLREKFPSVELSPHPTMAGFYARGLRADLLQIKRDLVMLDRPREPQLGPSRQDGLPARAR